MESSGAAADACAICLGDIGRGQAIFTAECSHAFHHRCISATIAHGHRECPLCRATWSDLPGAAVPVRPSARPRPPPPRAPAMAERPRGVYDYDDDEPVEQAVQPQAAGPPPAAADVGAAAVTLETYCERPAVPRAASRGNFPVLVHVAAPGAAADAPRAPLDLVTVLDLSGSMRGEKLALLKQAVGFVVDHLGPADRLSVVTFSNDARRVVRLARMSTDGKAAAKHAVESMVAQYGTNIAAGLRVAAKVLADRWYRNAVTGIILLSDGRDGYVRRRHIDLVPPSFRCAAGAGAGDRPGLIHTFGFGTEHDAAAMHTVAEETGSTFSFIENRQAIQDSFAQCIGGLLSVAVQELRVAVACVYPGVRVRGVKSGRYASHVDADRRAAAVDVGELYADEERRFLLFVRVPRAEDTEEATHLIKVRCTYRDTATGRSVDVAGDDAVVLRSVDVPDGSDAEGSMEVERERVRVAATEDIAAARAAAERREHAEAARILKSRRDAVRRSARGMAGDATCAALEDNLGDLGARVADRREYEQTGRACMLAGESSHRQQRASMVAVPWKRFARGGGALCGRGCGRGASRLYATPAMQNMVKISQSSREQQQQTSSPSPPAKRMRGS